MRFFLMVFVTCCLATSFLAQAAEGESRLKICRGMEDDVQRLKCYDAYADTTVSYMDNKFGKAKVEDVPEEKAFTVVSAKRQRDVLIIELDNGHVWKQTSTNKNYRLDASDEIVIESGFFSAYFLRKVGSTVQIKVQRVK